MSSPVNAIIISDENGKKHVLRIYKVNGALTVRQDDMTAIMGYDCDGIDDVDASPIGLPGIETEMFTMEGAIDICRAINTELAWRLHGKLQKIMEHTALMDSLGRIEGHLATISERLRPQ
jgi:hypothetical protein